MVKTFEKQDIINAFFRTHKTCASEGRKLSQLFNALDEINAERAFRQIFRVI